MFFFIHFFMVILFLANNNKYNNFVNFLCIYYFIKMEGFYEEKWYFNNVIKFFILDNKFT